MRRACAGCGKRPATFRNARNKRVADKQHDLCRRCYLAEVNRTRQVREKR